MMIGPGEWSNDQLRPAANNQDAVLNASMYTRPSIHNIMYSFLCKFFQKEVPLVTRS